MATPCRGEPGFHDGRALGVDHAGQDRGATSTMVSETPRAKIAFRIVKAMKPAPTMTTRVPGFTDAMPRGPRPGSRRGGCPARPRPGTAPPRPRARGDQAVVVLHRAAVVERQRVASRCRRGRPCGRAWLHLPRGERGRGRGEHVGLGDGVAQVVRQDHPGVGALGGDQGDLGLAAVLLADGPDGVRPAVPPPMTRCRAASARAWAGARGRSARAAKSPSQWMASDVWYTMACVGHASAHAGAPPHRLHLNAFWVSASSNIVPYGQAMVQSLQPRSDRRARPWRRQR